ncbi:hypothetical protein [Zhaonella formicivorans]|jgi:hypothetical protein|uniref:hypothetical protein n=1 Tax=Zhaonella formicivorans TaxID=2528593 RepID=UPI0010F42A87|nr:hypothetical protein [Zhaonella formicivorans]
MLNRRETLLNRKSSSLVTGIAYTGDNMRQKGRHTPLGKAARSDFVLNTSGAKLNEFEDL